LHQLDELNPIKSHEKSQSVLAKSHENTNFTVPTAVFTSFPTFQPDLPRDQSSARIGTTQAQQAP
jgi:hypothetical protein